MDPVKEPVKESKEVVAEAVVVPVINDSSAGLARMLNDLALPAARLRSSATLLLFMSILFMGTMEGFFGLIAACGVLCCAAPGALGTAHAARCTRITATISATLALMHIFCLSTFAIAVMPEMPHAFKQACNNAQNDVKLALPADGADLPRGGLPPTIFGGVLETISEKPRVITAGMELELHSDDEPNTKKMVAVTVAHVASTASRRLQELVPAAFDAETEPCARAERMFAETAPTLVWAAVFAEMTLFITAMSTARAAGRLVLLARSYGANGI